MKAERSSLETQNFALSAKKKEFTVPCIAHGDSQKKIYSLHLTNSDIETQSQINVICVQVRLRDHVFKTDYLSIKEANLTYDG